MRALKADEEALWAKVTATIRPLSRDAAEVDETPAATPQVQRAATPQMRAAPVPPAKAAKAPAISNNLDGHWDKRLRGGTIAIDRVIDLHGHRLDDAWHAIDQGIEAALNAGERVVLLITGHRRAGEPPVARGKIRAAVDDWLGASRHAPRIAAVRGAHPRHGGGGSLYLVLRRQ